MKKNKKFLIIALVTIFLVFFAIIIAITFGGGKKGGSSTNSNVANNTANGNSTQNNSTQSNTTEGGENTAKEGKKDGVYGYFAEYKGNTYYWKMDAESREKTTLYGGYGVSDTHVNSLVKRDSSGNETVLLQDTASGIICIANEKIYYNKNLEGGEQIVCSVDLEGQNEQLYNIGTLYFADGDYVYYLVEGAIESINSLEECSSNKIAGATEIIGIADKKLYYAKATRKNMEIGYVADNKNSGTLYTLKESMFETTEGEGVNFTILNFKDANNTVTIDVGNIQGTGHYVQQAYTITMNYSGSDVKAEKNEDLLSESTETAFKPCAVAKVTSEGIEFTKPISSKSQIILTNNDIASKLSAPLPADGMYSVYESSLNKSELYVVLDVSERDETNDIGWRPAYKRAKTVVFKYNIDNKSVVTIYEY